MSGASAIPQEPINVYNYASSGPLYAVQICFFIKADRVEGLDEGLYYFHPEEFAFYRVSGAEKLEAVVTASMNSPMVESSAFTCLLLGKTAVSTILYPETVANRFLSIEAGLIAQLLDMRASEHSLGLCLIGEVHTAKVQHLLEQEKGEAVLLSFVGGIPAR